MEQALCTEQIWQRSSHMNFITALWNSGLEFQCRHIYGAVLIWKQYIAGPLISSVRGKTLLLLRALAWKHFNLLTFESSLSNCPPQAKLWPFCWWLERMLQSSQLSPAGRCMQCGSSTEGNGSLEPGASLDVERDELRAAVIICAKMVCSFLSHLQLWSCLSACEWCTLSSSNALLSCCVPWHLP